MDPVDWDLEADWWSQQFGSDYNPAPPRPRPPPMRALEEEMGHLTTSHRYERTPLPNFHSYIDQELSREREINQRGGRHRYVETARHQRNQTPDIRAQHHVALPIPPYQPSAVAQPSLPINIPRRGAISLSAPSRTLPQTLASRISDTLLYLISPGQDRRHPQTRECNICAEAKEHQDFPRITEKCTHQLLACKECAQRWVKEAIRTSRATQLSCLAEGCDELLQREDFRRLATEEVFAD
jgi:hypothetical protein